MARNSKNTCRQRPLEESIGDAVRHSRATHGLTLSALAEHSGVSATMISKIERGRVSASLSTLDALAAAIGIPIANLFSGTVERRDVSFVSAGEGILVHRSGSTYGHVYKMIGKVDARDSKLESYIITLTDTAAGQPLLQHDGIEFIHMLEGSMAYRVGTDVFHMTPGDSVSFEAGAPHGPESLGSDSVRFLTVISRSAAAAGL